jgi:Holliday junction resolvasome RuvABC endonuclease subunit
MEHKKMIIGLDLSFNSTGITFMFFETEKATKIRFYRLVFDDESAKSGKQYKPHDIQNVNQIIYKMPTNVTKYDLLLTDLTNDDEQISTTLRAMICSKKITKTIVQTIDDFKPNEIIVSIENFIMPAFSGQNQLKTVAGLIMLQGFVRSNLIMLKNSFEYISTLKITTPPAKSVKLQFASSGSASKEQMIESFYKNYDGKKLLPNTDIGKIDDVVDSFALAMWGYSYNLRKINVKNSQIIEL